MNRIDQINANNLVVVRVGGVCKKHDYQPTQDTEVLQCFGCGMQYLSHTSGVRERNRMSKLDDIVDIGGAKPKEKIIAEIKDLMLELIGPDTPNLNGAPHIVTSNRKLAKLREKVSEL